MEKWEYFTTFLCANIEEPGVREYIQKRWPNWKNLDKYTPETMLPVLNTFGEAGWELLHIEPVALSKDSKVIFAGEIEVSTNWYFCVFKRRKEE